MNWLRIIGGVVAFVLFGLLVFAWFLPSEFDSENTINIKAPMEEVYNHVIDMQTWDNWQIIDTNIRNSVHTRNGVPDSLVWTGQAGVSGSIVIDSLDAPNYIRLKYQYANQPDDYQLGHMYFSQTENGTTVSWQHKHDVGWNPVLRFSLKYTTEWQELFDKTLEQLKEDIEGGKPDFEREIPLAQN